MIMGGVLSVIFGLELFAQPGVSLGTLMNLSGVFALVTGIFLLLVGFKLRKGDKWLEEQAA